MHTTSVAPFHAVNGPRAEGLEDWKLQHIVLLEQGEIAMLEEREHQSREAHADSGYSYREGGRCLREMPV
jgi:hypothetical protein